MKRIAIGLLVFALAVCFAVPAMAEFKPYASLRVITGWYDYTGNETGGQDDEDLWWELGDFSRFGGKFTIGDLGGHVEFGLKGDGIGGNSAYTRLLYGTWDFGGGNLIVGQDYNPYTFIAAQIAPRDAVGTGTGTKRVIDGENYFIGYGCLWDSRQPQVRLEMDCGFYVSLIQPETASSVAGFTIPAGVGVDEDTTLPKMCVGYEFKGEGFVLNPGFAYNTYELEIDALNWEEDIDSYLLYLTGKAGVGQAELQWSLHYGQNLGDFGIWSREDAAYAHIDVDGDVEDSDSYGGYVQVAFPLDPATITLGVGYVQSENDVVGDDEDEQMSYFIQAKIPLADTFWVVPEFSYYDQMENGTDVGPDEEPEAWFLGLMWRMDF